MKPFNVGDRVIVNVNAGSFQLKDAKGKIVFMDYSSGIYRDEFCPVQVELDEEYDRFNSMHKMIRVTLREVKRCEE